MHIHRECYDLAYNSQGALSYFEVYALPVQIRKFLISETASKIEEKIKATKNQS